MKTSMKTEDLIAALAADNETKAAPMSRAFALDLCLGFLVSAIGFFLFLGLRDTFFASLDQPRFLFKFVFTLTMAATGLALAWRLSRPGADPGLARRAVSAGSGAGRGRLPARNGGASRPTNGWRG